MVSRVRISDGSPSCGCGEIGRRTRLRIWRETMGVQVLSSAPKYHILCYFWYVYTIYRLVLGTLSAFFYCSTKSEYNVSIILVHFFNEFVCIFKVYVCINFVCYFTTYCMSNPTLNNVFWYIFIFTICNKCVS